MPADPATCEAEEEDRWSPKFEVAVSYDHATALQPG